MPPNNLDRRLRLPAAKPSQEPRRPFRAILCETPTVRVILSFHPQADFGGRLLQFRSPHDSTPWRYNEARVQCQHEGRECVPSVPKKQYMSQCQPCPCDPVPTPNFNVMGFGYVQLMLNKVLHSCERRVSTAMFRLLMVGLGGGSFTQPVRRRCQAHIDVIEKQKDVADAARLFLGYQEHEGHSKDERIIIADGEQGLQLAEASENHCGAEKRRRQQRQSGSGPPLASPVGQRSGRAEVSVKPKPPNLNSLHFLHFVRYVTQKQTKE